MTGRRGLVLSQNISTFGLRFWAWLVQLDQLFDTMVIGDEEDTFSLDHFIQLTQLHVQIYKVNIDRKWKQGSDWLPWLLEHSFQGLLLWFTLVCPSWLTADVGHNIWSTTIWPMTISFFLFQVRCPSQWVCNKILNNTSLDQYCQSCQDDTISLLFFLKNKLELLKKKWKIHKT